MAFWNTGAEPKRSNRWFVSIANRPQLQYALKKIDKPSFKVNEITHKYLNHEFYYPGRVEWNPISMTIASVTNVGILAKDFDAFKEDATFAIHSVFVKAGYIFPKGADATTAAQKTTLSKEKMNKEIGELSIKQINSDGKVIESWLLYYPQFTTITYGSLNYENDEIVDITVGIEYDWAELNPDGSVGRDIRIA